MDPKTALSLAYPLCVGLAAIGSGLGLGRMIAAALEAIARQPEAADKISVNMIIGAAFIEALTIYALICVFTLKMA